MFHIWQNHLQQLLTMSIYLTLGLPRDCQGLHLALAPRATEEMKIVAYHQTLQSAKGHILGIDC